MHESWKNVRFCQGYKTPVVGGLSSESHSRLTSGGTRSCFNGLSSIFHSLFLHIDWKNLKAIHNFDNYNLNIGVLSADILNFIRV